MKSPYPTVLAPEMVSKYPALAGAGGGYVWDEVLEYRVWCHPQRGAPDEFDGEDYYYAFETCEEALEFAKANPGSDEPLALILQKEHINETAEGEYVPVTEERRTEWPVEFLSRPRRTEHTIGDFLSPDAPPNRLEILRGLAPDPRAATAEPVGAVQPAPDSKPEGND
ncbi:GCN5 family acetyltransferase [Luteolibacter flavescens]|uniref:GCN5 family acetyltransferase n=1 Tax=Luteolibacter flavescens TaxID=1859460 RepID=A0ABT3FPE6_9BACT|nr:GCN5 family acetyltransferase [Luteolibacter flavescens]MCW1885448.1 GCN5 family acetyltransferase [Luteolibacter flavescens]